jgi:hypothetical protein
MQLSLLQERCVGPSQLAGIHPHKPRQMGESSFCKGEISSDVLTIGSNARGFPAFCTSHFVDGRLFLFPVAHDGARKDTAALTAPMSIFHVCLLIELLSQASFIPTEGMLPVRNTESDHGLCCSDCAPGQPRPVSGKLRKP